MSEDYPVPADEAVPTAMYTDGVIREFDAGLIGGIPNTPEGYQAVADSDELRATTEAAVLAKMNPLWYNARDFGALGDGSAGGGDAIVDAIAAAQAAVLASQSASSGLVFIPGGVYRTTQRLVVPPYVRLVPVGLVVLRTSVPADSALHITPLSSDPSAIYAVLSKQQWNRVPVGGLGALVLVNDLATGTTTGLELGGRASYGGGRQLARYSLENFAIQGYNVGQKINAFDHYIAAYRNFHIETNAIDIKIGDGAAPNNSGENFTWRDSVIAGADVGVQFDSDSFNTSFKDCSLDFLGTALLYNFGWCRTIVDGGHIEVINEGGRKTPTGGIAVSNVVSPNIFPDVIIRGFQPFVTHERNTHFRGNMRLSLEMQYRNNDQVNMGSEIAYLADDNVLVRSATLTNFAGLPRVSKRLGHLKDPGFSAEADGTASSALANYTVGSTQNTACVVSSDAPRAGIKSLDFVLTGSAFHRVTAKEYIPCQPGDEMLVLPSVKFGGAPYPALTSRGQFYDSNKVSIAAGVDSQHTITTRTGGWQAPNGAAGFRAPAGAVFFVPSVMLSSGSGDGTTHHYVSDIQVWKN